MKLRNCPFCGGEDLTIVAYDGYFVGCFRCKAFGPQGVSREEATAYWNRRAGDDLMERMEDDRK